MNQSISYYYLYCINLECKVSIHGQPKQTKLALSEANLVSTQTCPCCSRELVSSIDLGIESLLSNAGITNSKSYSIFQSLKHSVIGS